MCGAHRGTGARGRWGWRPLTKQNHPSPLQRGVDFLSTRKWLTPANFEKVDECLQSRRFLVKRRREVVSKKVDVSLQPRRV